MTVAVTGMGVVSPVGTGIGDFWRALCAGQSGIGRITSFDTDGFRCIRAGEVKQFRPHPAYAADAESIDMGAQFMMTAAIEAMAAAGLTAAGTDSLETGVVLATNFGGILHGERLFEHVGGFAAATAADARESEFRTAADHVAALWRLGGPRTVLSLSCASGTAALGHAANLIAAGRCHTVLVGGYDTLSRFAWAGLSALRTISATDVRPFDKDRDGTIFSAGAGALVLEDSRRAHDRGAAILAELAGHATNNNAYHMTAPAKRGAGSAAVMRRALQHAGMPPEAIDHINAHGTGTQPNDVTETQAIKDTFGSHARRMPVTSVKSMLGHMMGAAGTVEAIATVLSLRDGIVPPTINYATPDPECDLDCVVNEARMLRMNAALSNSAGIGGCNAAVIFTRSQSPSDSATASGHPG